MQSINLVDHFLIAMPSVADPHFAQTVTYICEHNDQGAIGIIINRPTPMTVGGLLAQMHIDLPVGQLQQNPVYFGGPVQLDRGFVLHQPVGSWNSTLIIQEKLGLTTSKDILEAISQGEGPQEKLITVGYASWTAGQLEHELMQNSWLTVPAQSEIIFNLPPEKRFKETLLLLGVDPSHLSSDVGHA